MIVTHPTGVVSEYTKENLQQFAMDIESDIARLTRQKNEIESQQIQIDAATSG